MQVSLPNSTTVDKGSSSCGTGSSSPWLVAQFGSGHALGLSFSINGSLYSVDKLTLQYNLSDTSIFPEANSSGENTAINHPAQSFSKFTSDEIYIYIWYDDIWYFGGFMIFKMIFIVTCRNAVLEASLILNLDFRSTKYPDTYCSWAMMLTNLLLNL